MKSITNPLETARSLKDLWFPKVIAELDDYYVKVARLEGVFTWHKHDFEDELFLVLEGQLQIEYEGRKVMLNAGDLHVVPKGVLHNPVAEKACLVMLIEHKRTGHTGDIEVDATRSIEEQLVSYKEQSR
jgi:mannose-6-phosphate isomerase-like protein (cupin superfamily)